jgi:hypothetical protein
MADNEELLVAESSKVVVFSESGQRVASHDAPEGVTAMLRSSLPVESGSTEAPRQVMVFGLGTGDIQVVPTKASMSEHALALIDPPRDAVLRLVPGPAGILIAGARDGTLGLWNMADGEKLESWKLHGPVVHLLVEDGTLYAASELGDYQVVDLSVYQRDYCALLREIWRDVLVVWKDGRAVVERPPEDHECSPK